MYSTRWQWPTAGEYGGYDPKTLRPEPGIWRWGRESANYKALCDRIGYALDMNPENRFLGMLWCQGEWDNEDAAGHAVGFDAMAEDFFARMAERFPGRVYRGDWNRGIWYNMETVAFWHSYRLCPMVWEHYWTWNEETYIPIPRDTDSNEVNGTGITAKQGSAHFGNGSFHRIIAPAVTAVMSQRLGGSRYQGGTENDRYTGK